MVILATIACSTFGLNMRQLSEQNRQTFNRMISQCKINIYKILKVAGLRVRKSLSFSQSHPKRPFRSPGISLDLEANIRFNSDCVRVLRVLIVEERPAHRYYLRQVLSTAGHFCTIASNTTDALSILGEAEFDAIFVSVRYPDSDRRKVLESARSRNIRVRAISISNSNAHPDELAQSKIFIDSVISVFAGSREVLSALERSLMPAPKIDFPSH